MLTLKWTVKIISDIIGSLIKKAVAACANKLAQFPFRMTVLKGRTLFSPPLSPFLSPLSCFYIRYGI